MHHSKITITGKFNITGRGLVLRTNFNDDGYKDLPYNMGDTFYYDEKLYTIRAIECFRDLIFGRIKANVGLLVKEI